MLKVYLLYIYNVYIVYYYIFVNTFFYKTILQVYNFSPYIIVNKSSYFFLNVIL